MASLVISSAAAVFWGTAILLVPDHQALGHFVSHLWLPLCPIGLVLIAWYVLSSRQAMKEEIQQLRHQMYNFKKA